MSTLDGGIGRAAAISFRVAPVQATVSIVLTVLMSAQTAALAVLLGMATNAVAAGEWRRAEVLAAALGVVIVAGLGVTWAAFGVRTVLEEKTLVAVDAELLGRVARLDGLAVFEQAGPVDELAALRRDRARLGNLLIILMTLLGAAVQLLLTVALLTTLTPVLGLVPALGLIPLLAGRRAEGVRQEAADRAAQADRRAGEWSRLGVSPELAAELAVTGMAERVRAAYAAADRKSAAVLDRGERRAATIVLLGNAVFAAGYMSAVVVAAVLAVRGTAEIGDVVLVAALGARVGGEISLISALAAALQAARTVLTGFQRLVVPEGSFGAEPAGGLGGGLGGGIVIRDLTFRYPGAAEDTLRGVSLSLAPGETVALVGANGAGKTTLVKLLCLFYPPPPGTITVGARPLERLSPAGWRAFLSAAFQDPLRTALSAREAVALGSSPPIPASSPPTPTFSSPAPTSSAPSPAVPSHEARSHDGRSHEARSHDGRSQASSSQVSPSAALGSSDFSDVSDEAVLGAFERAGVSELVARLPRGLDTELGDLSAEGVDLSGGQWQQLALARAMMRRQPLLIFLDEPASALDVATETSLLAAYARQRDPGTTGLIVTHRLAAARAADRIVVLHDGRVAEQGTHDELIAAGGIYAGMFAAQARGYE